MKSIGFKTKGLNGDPIVVKFTGLDEKSSNTKTGGMVQSYILPLAWVEQKRMGEDDAVCGDCVHSFKKEGTCYLSKGMPKMGLISTMKRMPEATAETPKEFIDLCKYLNGKKIRFGSYGEPVLMGEMVVREIATHAKTWTGYTHQWRKEEHQWAREFFMASADSEDGAIEARGMGWRTFRVRGADDDIIKSEISCPASKEMGRITTCAECHLCKGASSKAKNIVIIKH